jgi:NAD(P)-dependent dehydrogenase (short-subunit alcohol dehydrogenase family)
VQVNSQLKLLIRILLDLNLVSKGRGGGRGIGLAIVESFAKAQVKTIILTARSETFIQTVSSNLGFDKKYPATQFIGLPLEVTVEESINKLFDSLKDVVDHIGELFKLLKDKKALDFRSHYD